MVAGILRNHHGGILVESMVGRGAVFQVLLPHASKPPPTLELSPGAPGLKALHRKSRRKGDPVVLFADDEEMVRNVVATQLKNIGCQVVAASNGKKALELYEKHSAEISLVLLDVEMPGMSGIDTASAIRAADSELPIYLFSGYSEPEELRVAVRGLTGFLAKPIGQAELKCIVKLSMDE